MKRILIPLLLIGLVCLISSKPVYASYWEILDDIFGTKIAERYHYLGDGTTLISTQDTNTGEQTYYSGGRQLYTRDADGNLIRKFVYDGAKLVEEWFDYGPGLSTHSRWVYTNGKRDVAYDHTGAKIADAVYWQDLIRDGYFSKTEAEKEAYLANLLGTVTEDDIDDMRQALDELYAAGVANQNLAFQVSYVRNSDDTGIFAYQVTFYNERGKPLRTIYFTDSTIQPVDPVITGTIMIDGVGRYYLQADDGKKYYLAQNAIGRHDVESFSIWLGNTTGGVGQSLTVWQNGGWVTITAANAAQFGIQAQDLFSYLAANLGKKVTLIGDLGASGEVLYVQGVAR